MLVYSVACPACGAEWPDVTMRGAERSGGETGAIVTCPECFGLSATTVRLTTGEIAKYRRDIAKVLQKMRQSYTKVLVRLEERKRVLTGELRRGVPEVEETYALIVKRLAGMTPPDTRHLDARVKELARLEQAAPEEPDRPACPECGAATVVHHETYRGFEAPCPRCRTRLVVELKRGEAPDGGP
jgi:ssDNA-binding Zn-finger/Zn-ribbon topoisomerase 1